MDVRLFLMLMVSMGLALGFLKLFSGATQEWVSFTSEVARNTERASYYSVSISSIIR